MLLERAKTRICLIPYNSLERGQGAWIISIRAWGCPACYTTHDREINAARNIRVFGLADFPGRRHGVKSACREESVRADFRPKDGQLA